MNNERKERIIAAGIVKREDWDRLTPEHLEMANMILSLSDLQDANPEAAIFESDDEGSEEDQTEAYLNGVQDLHDRIELDAVDRVEPGKTFMPEEGVPIAIPQGLVPLFNKILREEQ